MVDAPGSTWCSYRYWRLDEVYLELGQAYKALGPEGVSYSPPWAIIAQKPQFPTSMKVSGVDGEISVLLTLDAEGTVVKATPPDAQRLRWSQKEVGQDMVDAVMKSFERGWRFQPATWRGRPIPATIIQKFRFELR